MHPYILAILPAIFALIGSGLGAYITANKQIDLWNRDVLYRQQTEMWAKRSEMLRAMTSALAEGRRTALYHGAKDKLGRQVLTEVLHCSNAENRRVDPDRCTFDFNDKETTAFAREVFEAQARFEAARASASAYFCAGTKAALEKLPAGGWYWNASEDAKARLLTAMEGEITCDLGVMQMH